MLAAFTVPCFCRGIENGLAVRVTSRRGMAEMNPLIGNSPTRAILGLMMLLSISAGAQKPETIQAQAFGTTTQLGTAFGITISIESYSTPEDQKTLIDAFSSGGHSALVDALGKMKGRGRVPITGGGVGYQ